MRRFLLLGLLGGCLDSAEVTGSGATTTHAHETLQCGSQVTLDRYLAGAGVVEVTILDGDGGTVFHVDDNVAGEISDSRDLGGAGGAWALKVDVDGFAGQFKIELACSL
jgi:hypothetical protein